MNTFFIKLYGSRFCAALLLVGSLFGVTVVARAADAPAPAVTEPVTHGEIKALDAFLDTHSVIADELRQHPGLADNPDFLKAHPEYATFVAEHPEIAEQLKAHPRYFMHRAMAAQRGQPVTADEVKKLDAFLDKHPEIEKELAANPKLIDDPKFIEAHPELHKFLNHHPRVDGALESKPNETMKREEHKAAK